MEYYVISPNVYNDGNNRWQEMFDLQIAAVGWSADSRKGKEFLNIEKGDCIIVALRQNWNWKYYYMGIVRETVNNPSLGRIEKSLFPIIDLKDMDLEFDKWSANGSNQISSPQRIKKEDNKIIIKLIDTIMKKTKYIDLLKSNKNLILTGAPGTGKTYLAKQIAAQMILEHDYDENDTTQKCIMDEQCGFVQFHPSYDYTDFVEGLRPIQDDNGNVGFKRKDGVFKDFCKKALQYASIDGVFDALIQDINSGKITTIRLRHQESSKLTVEGNNIRWYESNNPRKIADHCVSKENIKKLYSQYSTLDRLVGISNIDEEIRKEIGNCNSSYYYGILSYIIEKIGKKFVFVIDEINRGEISKIFGELFFSIDPGYRGEKGKVKTQYQNLVEEGDAFHDGFFVPENVYIIGTMNDIDRSVESMDFAMRRRFAFKEITAKDSMQMLDDDKAWKGKKPDPDTLRQLKDRMTSLNNKIWHEAKQGETEDEKSIEGLSSAYHIGASYFLKLGNYASFEGLWDYHLYGLLFEYLRGLPNAETDMEKLKKAYYLEYRYSKDDNEKIIVDENSNE